MAAWRVAEYDNGRRATGLNAGFYETRLSAKVLALDPHGDPPRAAKLVGSVSLVSWFAVRYCGRMLTFIGDAF